MKRPIFAAVAVAASAVLLGGCAAGPAPAPTESAASAAGYPVSLKNCGVAVSVAAEPQRVVTIKSSATELILALGLEDRLVGSAFLDGPLPAHLEAAGSTLNVMSEFLPGQEAVLGLTPDFIYGGWESNFSADGVGERDRLADLDIGSYVSPAACKDPAYMPDPLTFE